MDANVIAAILTALGTIAAALIGVWVSRYRNQRPKANRDSKVSIKSPQVNRSLDHEKAISSGQASAPKSEVRSAGESSEQRDILETGGVLQVLRERILKRVVEHLDPSVRRYETLQAVEEGCRSLAATIRQDEFAPDIIISWENPETGYQGSQTIAKLMSRELGVSQRLLTIQEIRENREVTEDCQWFRNIGRALIVDDACYSGSTFRSIQRKLSKINPDADIRFAVLSTHLSLELRRAIRGNSKQFRQHKPCEPEG